MARKTSASRKNASTAETAPSETAPSETAPSETAPSASNPPENTAPCETTEPEPAAAEPPSDSTPSADSTWAAPRTSRSDDESWSTWSPSAEANIEVRWRTVAISTSRGSITTFPVQVDYLEHLGGPGASPLPLSRSRRLRPDRSTTGLSRQEPTRLERSRPRAPGLGETAQTLRTRVVDAVLSPSATSVPFSLYAPNDSRPLFKGMLEALYPSGAPGGQDATAVHDGSADESEVSETGASEDGASETPVSQTGASETEVSETGDANDAVVRLLVRHLVYRPGTDIPVHQLVPAPADPQ